MSDSHATTDVLDVLIVGAGISGISSAYYLTRNRPDDSFLVIDAYESYGGTWHLHRYPGARSDSDLFTFGFGFKPWVGNPIATREQILSYLGEVIDENGLAERIRYGKKVTAATWSSETNEWFVSVTDVASGEITGLRTRFLWMCQGYYDHTKGYTPQWAGLESYTGMLVHPQHWPEDLDVTGKEVIVIGSGATAATLVPALAETAGHVTMLQRTPTFFSAGRNADELANELRKLEIPQEWIHEIMRRKVVRDRAELIENAKAQPEAVRGFLMNEVRKLVGPDVDVDEHFNPPYRPMQQRIAFVPDGDLFTAIREKRASVVTDHIDTFTEHGIRLKSGDELTGDIIITATGFNLAALGGVQFEVDGESVAFSDTVTYRGMMFTGMPNLVWIFGYSYHSWTLRAELIGQFVCRLLEHMERTGARRVVPELPEELALSALAWGDPEEFNAGYLMRNLDLMPKFAEGVDWRHSQDYEYELKALPEIDLASAPLRFA